MRRFVRLGCLAAAVALLAATPGCGPKKVKVSGRFVKNGQTHTFPEETYVTVQFVPVNSEDARKSYPAHVDNKAGTYEVEVLAGRYRISFLAMPSMTQPTSNNSPAGPALPRKPSGAAADPTEYEFKSNTTQDITVP